METTFKTEQEKFWAGQFGTEYTDRNQSARLHAANMDFFSRIVGRTRGIRSLLEFGANRGLNIHALKALLPGVEASAIEINEAAVEQLGKIEGLTIYHQSILDFVPVEKRDFVFTKGVLIHINPDQLPYVNELLYRSSSKYVCVAEYYNPAPVEIPYRGHSGKMFKRDFAGDLMKQFPDLKLVDYGFAYHKDPVFPQDDITWFLLEKI